jgi:hypothetical protein
MILYEAAISNAPKLYDFKCIDGLTLGYLFQHVGITAPPPPVKNPAYGPAAQQIGPEIVP